MYIIKKCKPTSPGRRNKINIINTNIKKKYFFKKLLKKKKKKTGRNNQGRITVRHIGGCNKKYYRKIDFYRKKDNIFGKVINIEYDPNRTANIALISYKDGEYKYILSPKNIKIGDEIISGLNVPIKIGNSLLIKNIPVGINIHCIEILPGKGAKFSRTAGSSAIIVLKEKNNKYVQIKLRSGEIRRILSDCKATIGEIGNEKNNLKKLGKAGSSRLKGIRPTVRGVAMNPVDHPHGGGEGKTSGGRHPVTPWGKKTKGKKTRKNKKTNFMIISKK